VAANFLVDEIRDSLNLWLDTLEISARVAVSPYDSVIQELLKPHGLFAEADVGAVFLQLERWCLPQGAQTEHSRENIKTLVHSVCSVVAQPRPTGLFVMSCPPSSQAIANGVREFEQELGESLYAIPKLKYIASDELQRLYPVADYEAYFALRSRQFEDLRYSELGLATMATMLARYLYTHFKGSRKVIAVDCDNTLWSGVCAELGPHDVVVSGGNKLVQETLVQQWKHGKLICIVSKNSEHDVKEVFRCNSQMILKPEHVSRWCVNWNPKYENLIVLASELGLGLEGFLFLDDDGVECEAMKTFCPEVCSVRMPQDEADVSAILLNIWDFDSIAMTAEDQERSLYYRQNRERDLARDSAISLEEFLSSLELRVVIGPLELNEIPRATQLMQRVNQFNLNGIHYTSAAIGEFMSTAYCYTVRASDRFGDHGLVGLIIFRIGSELLIVQSLLLSCRALGRGVEHHIARFLIQKAQETNSSKIKFDYQPTPRNAPIREFIVELAAKHGSQTDLLTIDTKYE
jgi:FkbH-like protein